MPESLIAKLSLKFLSHMFCFLGISFVSMDSDELTLSNCMYFCIDFYEPQRAAVSIKIQ